MRQDETRVPMTSFALRGWCPDAWRPMMAGDGLIVRVKPRLARLTAAEIAVLADLARRFGSGAIDITNRANLQIRGVREQGWQDLLRALVDRGLVDSDAALEGRRNLLVAPGWDRGDDTARIAEELLGRLGELPELPGKMGIAVDAGPVATLLDSPADFRIERAEAGGLLLRLDGRESGVSILPEEATDRLIALAHWFVETGGAAARRASRHTAALPQWARGDGRPAVGAAAPHGYGVPFGRIEGEAMVRLMAATGAAALRVTSWRQLLAESEVREPVEGFIRDPGDPLLRADACPGAPTCPQATVETRELARRLAPHVSGRLHVSGCAKGCARARPSDVVLTGRDGVFDLALRGRAGDPPTLGGLSPDHVLAHFGAS